MREYVELVWDGQDLCGEAPLWLARERQLVWLDITGRKLHALAPGEGAPLTPDRDVPASGLAVNHTGELGHSGGGS